MSRFNVDFKRRGKSVVKNGYVGGGGRVVGVLLESRLRPSLGLGCAGQFILF